MAILTSAIAQGLLWSVLAMGIYVSYRILNISDLSSESSFTLGAAVCATALINGLSPFIAILLAIVAGSLAGLITGLLNTMLKIPSLLAGILTMTGLYSINLRIMGKANIPLNNVDTLLSNLKDILNLSRDRQAALPLGIITIIILILLMTWFFNTEIGYSIIATGSNDHMVAANGINPNLSKTLGLMIANGLIALSGSLVAQYNGFADVQMGIGAIVIGLASLIMGEVISGNKALPLRLLGIVLGSIIYRLLVALAINSGFVSANDIRLFTAILVALAIYLSQKAKGKNYVSN